MGLDFTSIKDRHGAAVYIIHSGNVLEQRAAERLAADLAKRAPKHQIEVLSAKSKDGESIVAFYSLNRMSFPHVLVVRDDDQLAHHWYGQSLPTAEQMAFSLQRVTES